MPKGVEQDLREALIVAGRDLLQQGLVTGTWGNLSVRRDAECMLITPSGRSYATLSPDDLPLVGLAGKVLSGCLEPSSELPLHLAIYQAHSHIGAIVHTHSLFASACAVAHHPIPALIEDLVQVVGGEVKVAAYALPGTPELAANAIAGLGERRAVLLANHGLVGCGSDLAEAVLVCQLVEKAAQILIYAKQLGQVVPLSEQDVALMHGFYEKHYKLRQRGGDL